MSVRASASLPSSCSGAMYWKVPRIVPSCVSPCCVGSAVRLALGSLPAPSALARPKSSSFTPDFVSITLAGLQVAVHDALPVRLVQRVGDLDAVAQRLLERQRALARGAADSVSPSSSSITRYSVSPSRPTSYSAQMCGWESCEIVSRLALEALPHFGRGREVLAAEP